MKYKEACKIFAEEVFQSPIEKHEIKEIVYSLLYVCGKIVSVARRIMCIIISPILFPICMCCVTWDNHKKASDRKEAIKKLFNYKEHHDHRWDTL